MLPANWQVFVTNRDSAPFPTSWPAAINFKIPSRPDDSIVNPQP
jgi:hypothetical protein